nr:hypothetical protein [Vibrio vulnificus]
MSDGTLGSHWYKFDFHTHTPESSDYKQPEEAETDWLKALMLEGIDCVAVTDHVLVDGLIGLNQLMKS